ncbi:MAG: mechanosensitive ion channel family protein [Halohasta sp.]
MTGDAVVLQAVPSWLQEVVASTLAFIPRLVGAVVILLVGWVVGRAVAKVVGRLADTVELDRAVLSTPIGEMLGGTEQAVSNAFGTLAAWFVYAIAILAAANALAIETLSTWVATAVSYLPAFIAGLLVIVLGFVVADFLGDAIARTQAATQSAFAGGFAAGTKLFLYFTAIVIGLDTMGIDVAILYLFARALAYGLAAAVAIGAGVAIGLGGREYVEDNIGRWMGSAREAAPDYGTQQGHSGPEESAADD